MNARTRSFAALRMTGMVPRRERLPEFKACDSFPCLIRVDPWPFSEWVTFPLRILTILRVDPGSSRYFDAGS